MLSHIPQEAEIIERIEEAPGLFTLHMRFTDPARQATYRFEPGQFNMLYLFGAGEIPISIVSDPRDEHRYAHTIRSVGRITNAMAALGPGDRLGVRGPFGRGWPMQRAEQKDIAIISGGLGCAPTVSVIHYIMQRRERFGTVNIVQGVKHSNDFIWREHYDQWRNEPDTHVLLAADSGDALWPWHVGPVTGLFEKMQFDPHNTMVFMCGPEGMMRVVIRHMLELGVPAADLWLSMERNMQCATGFCGHCQLGDKFICRDGPVFCYEQVRDLLAARGI